jgi:uncharacterized protein with GYD domain
MRSTRRGSVGLVGAGAEAERRHRTAIEALGGKVNSYRIVTGQYDLVMNVDLPDEVSSLFISHAWNVGGLYVEALRAFSSEELEQSRALAEKLRPLLDQERARNVESSEGQRTP